MEYFNDILKEKLYNYKETPPIEIFDDVRKKYPKKNFFSTTKFLVISSLTVSVIAVVLIILLSSEKTENKIHTSSNEEKNININIDNTNQDNKNTINEILVETSKDTTSIESEQKNNPRITMKQIEIFNFKDTSVCGLLFETININNPKNIIIPKGLKLLNSGLSYKFVAENSGKYLIKYKEQNANEILMDSVLIIFNNISLPKFNYSTEKLCYNQDLIITIDNPNNYTFNWDIDGAKITQKAKNQYEINNLHKGMNSIMINYLADNCQMYEKNEIEVMDKPKYTLEQKADYCSETNGEIKIKLLKLNPDYYLLDNEIVNKTGIFKKLHSGIHNISIKYNDDCYLTDTIFVYDSLKLKPFFTIDNGLIDKNNYLFNNLTEIDYKGFEKNKDIEFLWKINNEIISNNDNLSHKFENSGKYNVKLIAKINDNCVREYSEDIIISSNNINIPNVFTPNGDGVGDYFEIRHENSILQYNIKIMRQNGEILFESNDINKSWDGKISGNNDAAVDIYYYIISITEQNGSQINHNGNIQLLR